MIQQYQFTDFQLLLRFYKINFQNNNQFTIQQTQKLQRSYRNPALQLKMSFHSSAKTSINRTGIMFYDRIPDTQKFKVKFKSFNLAIYDNQKRVNQVQQIYKNYVLFKQGKCTTRQRILSQMDQRRNRQQQKYKTNKQRVKQNQNLRTRLKSMKNERKSLLEKIKLTKDVGPQTCFKQMNSRHINEAYTKSNTINIQSNENGIKNISLTQTSFVRSIRSKHQQNKI